MSLNKVHLKLRVVAIWSGHVVTQPSDNDLLSSHDPIKRDQNVIGKRDQKRDPLRLDIKRVFIKTL